MWVFLAILTYMSAAGLVFVGVAYLYGRFFPDQARRFGDAKQTPRFGTVRDKKDVAILIACYRGAGTIESTVTAALKTGCVVFVVDDGSKQRKGRDSHDLALDQTTETARSAGAIVLELTQNVGKPAAILKAYTHFELSHRYKAVAIFDDDVTVKPDFIRRCLKKMTRTVVIVVGKNITWWPKEQRWNIWLAKRAFSYWNYQLITRRIQSLFGVMNCISGSNSVYRTELLDQVLVEKTPYIVDDTYWVLETQRRNLGRITYAPKAHAYLQDPTIFKDWYKQNLRWLWGTFQGVIGHNVGRRATRFDFAYVLLMIQWFIYVASAPVAIVFMALTAVHAPLVLLTFVAGYGIWVTAAAIQLRHFHLVLFIPAIFVGDFIYRYIFVHALIKALREPTVEDCVWESPTRIARTT